MASHLSDKLEHYKAMERQLAGPPEPVISLSTKSCQVPCMVQGIGEAGALGDFTDIVTHFFGADNETENITGMELVTTKEQSDDDGTVTKPDDMAVVAAEEVSSTTFLSSYSSSATRSSPLTAPSPQVKLLPNEAGEYDTVPSGDQDTTGSQLALGQSIIDDVSQESLPKDMEHAETDGLQQKQAAMSTVMVHAGGIPSIVVHKSPIVQTAKPVSKRSESMPKEAANSHESRKPHGNAAESKRKDKTRTIVVPSTLVGRTIKRTVLKKMLAPVQKLRQQQEQQEVRDVHIFVDMSNIVIGFWAQGAMLRGAPKNSKAILPLAFDQLQLVLERGRSKVTKRVAAGSIRQPGDAEPSHFIEAVAAGYDMHVLHRVWHRRAHRQGGSGKPASKEQGVDELIHLHMANSLMDAPRPGVMVIASGDAAPAQHSQGFAANAVRALQRGWIVEVVGWRNSISGIWRAAPFTTVFADRFAIVELDTLYYLLHADWVPQAEADPSSAAPNRSRQY